jgi:DNA-binding MarR family transcriptional regulator
MEALELVALGRRLAKIGEEAMRGSRAPALPSGQRLVLRDVFAHPDSSVSDVTDRTGMPQGYVSECIARLRDAGLVETTTDPSDGRRTLVRFSRGHVRTVVAKGAVAVDATLSRALSESDPDKLAQIVVALSTLADRLRPVEPGAVRRQLSGTQEA